MIFEEYFHEITFCNPNCCFCSCSVTWVFYLKFIVDDQENLSYICCILDDRPFYSRLFCSCLSCSFFSHTFSHNFYNSFLHNVLALFTCHLLDSFFTCSLFHCRCSYCGYATSVHGDIYNFIIFCSILHSHIFSPHIAFLDFVYNASFHHPFSFHLQVFSCSHLPYSNKKVYGLLLFCILFRCNPFYTCFWIYKGNRYKQVIFLKSVKSRSLNGDKASYRCGGVHNAVFDLWIIGCSWGKFFFFRPFPTQLLKLVPNIIYHSFWISRIMYKSIALVASLAL